MAGALALLRREGRGRHIGSVSEGSIFVSYRRSDAAGFAFSLHERLLEEFGSERLFMDVDTIDPGAAFGAAIRENLERCQLLLAVIGRDWLQAGANGSRRIDDPADWVRIEVSTALARKIPVIPVLVGGVTLPRAKDLPEPLKELSRRQSIEVRNASFRSDTDRLLDAIERGLSGSREAIVPRRTWRSAAAMGLLSCFMLLASWTTLFNAAGIDDALDGFFLARFQGFSRPASSPSLLVVTASDRHGGNGPLLPELPGPGWRKYHAALIDALSAAGARVIAFDILFEGASSGDAELARAITEAGERGTAVVLASDKVRFGGGRAIPAVVETLATAPWGLVSGSPERSRMPLARRGPESWWHLRPEPVVPSLALAAVAQFRRAEEGASAVVPSLGPRGDTVQLRTEAGRVVDEIPVLDKHLSIAVAARDAALKPFPFQQIYENRTNPRGLASFKDALVLVGVDERSDAYAAAPGAKQYGVEYHALAINQLLERRYVRRPTALLQAALILLMAALGWLHRSELHPLLRHRIPLSIRRRGEKTITVSSGLVASTVLYLFAALLAFRWWALLLRTSYDVVTLWAAYFAVGIARRGGLFRVPVRTSVLAFLVLAAHLLTPRAAESQGPVSQGVARADPPPLAQVVKIVANGLVKNEASTAEAQVVKAGGGTVDPAAAGQLLAAGDELDTGPGVSVEIQYLFEAVERDKTIIVGPASRVRIEDPTSLRVILGRLLSNVRGYFEVPSGDTVLAVRGTEFEVRVADDDGTRLLVLQGAVSSAERVVRRLQEITIPPGRRLAANPVPANEATVRSVLHWTSEPIAAGRPPFGISRTMPTLPAPPNPSAVLEETRFRAIVKDEPGAMAKLGHTYVKWGEGAKAVDTLGQAVRADPGLARSPAMLTDLGNAYRLKGDLDDAESAVRRAIELDRHFGPAHNALGNVFLDRAEIANQGQDAAVESRHLDQAEEAFDAFFERSAQDPLARSVALTSRGQVLVRKADAALKVNNTEEARRRFDQARDSFRSAARTRPDYSYSKSGAGDALRGLAKEAARRGDKGATRRNYREAESAYGEALGTDPRLTPALLGLGTVYRETGRQAEARATYRRAVATRPRDALAHYQLGSLESELGDRGAAARMEAYLALENPRLRDGVRARHAREVIKAGPSPEPTLGPTPEPTLEPTPGPTPTPWDSPLPSTPVPTRPNIRVPNVERMTGREALWRLETLGLRGVIVEDTRCDRIGEVLGSDPRADRLVAPGFTVRVVVGSTGRYPAGVPSLRGASLKQAQGMLNAAGLRGRVRMHRTGRARPGTVLAQRPEPPSRIARGCVVEITIEAQQEKLVSVPSFVGMTEAEVRRRLSRSVFGTMRAGSLRLGKVYGAGAPNGRVARQHPAPGAQVPAGTTVDLWIRGSRKPPQEPIG